MKERLVSVPPLRWRRKALWGALAASVLQACSTSPSAPQDRSEIEAARKKAQSDPTKERTFYEIPKNPSVPAGGSIQEFSVALNDTRYYFDVYARVSAPSLSGERTEPQKVFKGMAIALAPATGHCTRAGGLPTFAELLRPYWVSTGTVPQRVLCQRDGQPLWALDIRYLGVTELEFAPYLFVGMTLRTELLSPEQYAIRLRSEQERTAAADAQRERQAVVERERQQRITDQAAEARRLEAQRVARVASFQANLKAGDRFVWVRPPSGIGGPVVGLVVRVEGAVAFVQLDNLTISKQQTRYIPRGELEPLDAPTPNVRWSID